MHPMLNIAVRAARRAGSIINRAALDGGGGLKVTSKRAKDFVTQIDQAKNRRVSSVWLVPVDGSTAPRKLTGTQSARNPRWMDGLKTASSGFWPRQNTGFIRSRRSSVARW